MVDYFFVLSYNYHLPNHRDIRHTWKVNLDQYPEESSNYKPKESEAEAQKTNFTRILQQIQNHPWVEALAVSFWGSTPGAGNYSGRSYQRLNDTIVSAGGQMTPIDPDYDFFRVFGYTSDNGKKAASVRDFDWNNPNAIVVGRSVIERLFPDSLAIGKEIRAYWMGKEYNRNMIAGVVDDVKRFDYERPQNTFYIPQRIDAANCTYAEISIRSKSSLSDPVFREIFQKEMTNALQTGNFYFKNIVSYPAIHAQTDRMFGQTNDVYVRICLMIFFLFNILLCVIGTFWYRIHLRREETGIRKAFGASKTNIRNALLLEGLCLLTVAMLPAMAVEFQFVHAGVINTLGKREDMPEVYLLDRTLLRFLITNGISWLIMAAVIVFAIWIPALKAAAMQPVEALRYE
jgi:hypothetical protein